MGPLKILAPAGGMLAPLAWLLALLESDSGKSGNWITDKHTHKQTLENFIIRCFEKLVYIL